MTPLTTLPRLTLLALLLGAASCNVQQPVQVIDPSSACERLRTSYPSAHGLVLFAADAPRARSIPWCFPGTRGFGVIGYNINIPVQRAGMLDIALSEIRPPVRFAAVSIDVSCAGDSTGKRFVRLGFGTQWSLPVEPGDYCISLITEEKTVQDVWFTLTVTRP
ncbi:hypothetical protein [Pseudomonas sp. AN-1]|uniref:hypothetical protein n=1 Tax=Pseudomonas sp. AN-1 TaxID=3096605 RepID=UPI002A69D042|nr:hypothetical protein [Pseudomonas sp. AN-1]WPP46597.1 hypothetical protein SK095_04185 [Pseudomonas sp. AN-1]